MPLRLSGRIAFWNCRGLASSLAEINQLTTEETDLLFLSETHDQESTLFIIPNYDVAARLDHPKSDAHHQRGLMILSRRSEQGAVLRTCSSEDSWVVVDYGNVCLFLIYLPPWRSRQD